MFNYWRDTSVPIEYIYNELMINGLHQRVKLFSCHQVKCLCCTYMCTVWPCKNIYMILVEFFVFTKLSICYDYRKKVCAVMDPWVSKTVFHPADSQQPVAESCSRRLRGVLLHAAPRLPSLRHFLLTLPAFGRRCRRPRLRGLPQPAEPVRSRLPQQLLQRRLPPHAGPQRSPRLRDQAGVWEALIQHRRAAHEGQGAHSQHLVGHVIRVPYVRLAKLILFLRSVGGLK